jgi:hypothetical protein
MSTVPVKYLDCLNCEGIPAPTGGYACNDCGGTGKTKELNPAWASYMTCPHCKTEAVMIECCRECGEYGDEGPREVGAGDECLTTCRSCRVTEGGYEDKPFCPNCEEKL